MKLLSIQEAYSRKFERQRAIPDLEYHAAGHCCHIGKLSPGCYACFVPVRFSYNIVVGPRCNLNCAYCFTKDNRPDETITTLKTIMGILGESRLPGYRLHGVSFTGRGDPLLYLDRLRKYVSVFREIERERNNGAHAWYYLYTNGLLADPGTLGQLRDMGFDEIRFHLGASNFSAKAYQNLRRATAYFKAVTVETPSWPPHRKQLFEMLPIIEDIGVKHLNLGEIEVTQDNLDHIATLPGAQLYQGYQMHLYDDGLVYDIIEEVLKKRYSYSVLDCNCFVKTIQRSPAKSVYYDDITGLIAEY